MRDQPRARRAARSASSVVGDRRRECGSRSPASRCARLQRLDRARPRRAARVGGGGRARRTRRPAPGRARRTRPASRPPTPGLASTAGSGGRPSAGPSFSPRPAMRRARGSRQTGTSAPTARAAANRRGSSRREAVGGGERAQRGGRVARAAAEAGGDRQDLPQMEAPEPQAGHPFGERARRAQHEIVGGRPGGRRGRPVDRQAQRFAAGSNASQSQQPAKATRLSSSCQPSARRPST